MTTVNYIIRRGKQILPQQNDLFAHLHHLYFITVIRQSRNIWYKGRKDTAVLGGRQFARYNVSILSLCLNRDYTKDFFLCGSLQVCFTNLVTRKPAFLHHLCGKKNYEALFVHLTDLNSAANDPQTANHYLQHGPQMIP